MLLYPYGTLLLGGGAALTDRIDAAGGLSLTLVSMAFAATAALWACEWRLSREPASAAAAAAAAFVAVQHLPPATLGFGQDPGVLQLDAGHALVAVVAGWLLTRGGARAFAGRAGPVTIGLVLGVLVMSLRLGLVYAGMAPELQYSWPHDAVIATTVAVGIAYLGWAIARCGLPTWVKWRAAAALVLTLAGGLLASATDGRDAPPAAVALYAAAAGLLLAAAAWYLHQTTAAQRERIARLLVRAARSEARVKHEREIVHEVKTTVAGLAAAADLLAGDDPRLSDQRRARLATMVHAEASRLTRLYGDGQGTEPRRELAIDEVVGPQVMAHRALGHRVTWEPTGLLAVGQPDSLSTVLDTLLSNAARHGGAGGATVTARVDGDRVEILVADDGRGVNKYMAKKLFRWDGRRRGSPGSGIGLQHAARLMHEQGGTLKLGRTGPSGVTFIARLPAVTQGSSS